MGFTPFEVSNFNMGFTPVEVSNFYPRETFTPAEISNYYMRNLYTPRSLQTPFTPVEVSNFYPDGLQPVQARLHLSNISALNTCRTFHLCISQCLPRPVSLEPMSAASGGLQPVHARPCPSMPVHARPCPFTLVQHLPFYTRRSLYMVFLNAYLARSPWV